MVDAAAVNHQTLRVGSEHERQTIERVVESLTVQFPDRPTSEITAVVKEEYAVFEGRPVRDYVAVLVEHGAKETLRRTADVH